MVKSCVGIPDHEDHSATGFQWDLFVVAGNPTVHQDAYAGSDNVNKDNMFNSPDGIAFDRQGGLWIQTDGNYSNSEDFAGQGNNQMLLGDTVTGEIKRFLVGPRECEITGITWSRDGKNDVRGHSTSRRRREIPISPEEVKAFPGHA